MDDLTVPIKSQLEENGFVIIKNILKTEACRKILDWFSELESLGTAIPQGYEAEYETETLDGRQMLRKLRRLLWNNPEFWIPIIRSSRIPKIMHNLVGNNAVLIFHAAFMKSKKIGDQIAFHQDQALWRFNYPNAVNCWVALSPATHENGCIIGYPKSHLLGLIAHVMQPEYKWHPSLKSSEHNLYSPIDFELAPGDAVVWHRYLVHGSAANQSSIDRKGMVLVFADGSVPDFRATDQYSVE